MKKSKICGLIGISLFLVSCVAASTSVYADSNDNGADWNTIKSKAALYGVFQCADKGYYASEWETESYGRAFYEQGKTRGGDKEMVKLPYGKTDATDNNASCWDIVKGWGQDIEGDDLNKGLIPEDIRDTKEGLTLKNFFANAYTAEETGGVKQGQETQQLVLKLPEYCTDESDPNDLGPRASLYINSTTGNNYIEITDRRIVFPKITKDGEASWGLTGGSNTSAEQAGVNVPPPSSTDNYIYEVRCDGNDVANFAISDWSSDPNNPDYGIGTDPSNPEQRYQVSNGEWIGGDYKAYSALRSVFSATLEKEVIKGKVTDTGNYNSYKMVKTNAREFPMSVVRMLNTKNQIGYKVPNLSNIGSLALQRQEVYDLYQYYVVSVFKAPVACVGEDAFENYKEKGYPPINWMPNKECYINTESTKIEHNSSGNNVYGVGDSYYLTKEIVLQDAIDTLNGLGDLSDLKRTAEGGNRVYDNEPTDPEPGTEEPEEPNCLNSGAAASLGWIVCPLMNWLSDAAESMYEDWIEPALRIPPKLFADDQGSVLGAWGIFQGFANIAMIIILLVVIFSQITGTGIDNYGIKKILPKLIISAILINLSYIICQVCVDISNIVGNSVQDLFNTYNVDWSKVTVFGIEDGLESVGTTALTGVAILGLIAVQVWAVVSEGGGQALVLAILLAAITVVVSIFFLFVLLAAREAAVIVLIIISPLAFACNILPNTKSLFDKWIKMGKGLLLVYPIAGLLVGGGNFVSKVLLATGQGTDGFFPAFMAMVIGVVPIFFIPTVLKNSLNALGSLGAKISGFGKSFGSRLSGNVSKGVKNTAGYKERQARFNKDQQFKQEQKAAERAKTIKEKLGALDRDSLTSRQRHRLTEAERTINAQRQTEASDAVGVFEVTPSIAKTRAESAKELQERKAYADQYSNFNRSELAAEAASAGGADGWFNKDGGTQRMSALIGAMESNGMEADIYDMLRNNDNVGKNASVMQTLANSKNKVLKAYGKKGENKSYNEFMNGTGAGTLQAYAKEKGRDFVSGLDDKALKEINSYSNSNPNIMSTDQLLQAGIQLNDVESINAINEMLKTRTDIDGNIASGDIAGFNDTTIDTLLNNDSGRTALASAAAGIDNDPQLASKITSSRRQKLENAGISLGGPAPTSTSTPTQSPTPTLTPTSTPTPTPTPSSPSEAFIVHGASGDQAIIIQDGRAFDQSGKEFDNSRSVAEQVRQVVERRNKNGNDNGNNNNRPQ